MAGWRGWTGMKVRGKEDYVSMEHLSVMAFWGQYLAHRSGDEVGYWVLTLAFVALIVFALGNLEARRARSKAKAKWSYVAIFGRKRRFPPFLRKGKERF